ncbi:hypothetical protein [Pseudoxanthomonas mexicana]|uniref:hypothetical protein n=1 Tax=Pseudoxanthomonas mexicana TaxID=128785 RepID=UPI00398BA931
MESIKSHRIVLADAVRASARRLSVGRHVLGANGARSISCSLRSHPAVDRKQAESRMRSLLEQGGYLFTPRSVNHCSARSPS